MRLITTFDLQIEIPSPTPFVMMLRPRSGAQQWITMEEYRISPFIPVYEFTDTYGNLCQRLLANPGPFSVHTSAEVETADVIDKAPGAPFFEIVNLPDATLCYLLPSRYCESDRLSALANNITAQSQPGYDQVASITAWLRNNIDYRPGESDEILSAVEVATRQWGVCRDLAHLGIALCRSLSIPARMVVGYLHNLEPMDLHAWFEAYVGGRWFTFDATQRNLRGGYVAIGYGRDAADVAIYTQFGPPVFPIVQRVSVRKVSPSN